jgi:hypothetical protein
MFLAASALFGLLASFDNNIAKKAWRRNEYLQMCNFFATQSLYKYANLTPL